MFKGWCFWRRAKESEENEKSSAAASGSNTGIIAGAAIGGFAVFAVAMTIFVRSRKKASEAYVVGVDSRVNAPVNVVQNAAYDASDPYKSQNSLTENETE